MSVKDLLTKSLPHILAIVVLIIASVAFFYPQLEGKKIAADDIVSGELAAGEVEEYNKITGKEYLWSNAQFGGMPRMMWVPMKYNKINSIFSIAKLGFDAPIGIYLATMILAYLLYYLMGCSQIIAVSLAIATALGTSNVMLWQAGHYSKIATLASTPILILGVFQVFEKRSYLLGGILYCLALSISLFHQHPQMTYYIFMILAVYGIVKLVRTIKEKSWKPFFIGAIVVLIGTVLAVGVNSTRLLSVYDYSKQTLRGPAVLTEPATTSSDFKSDGLDFDYAMQWSSDWKDITATFLVPGFVGGGSGEKVGRNSESYQKFRIDRAPLYWGNLPFTVGPMYIGVVVFFLFVLALFLVEGTVKWWLGTGVFFLTLCAMGSHVGWLNQMLFDYLPLYNKFRAPQSILNVVLFFIPVLAALGIAKLISIDKLSAKKKKSKLEYVTKSLYYTTAIIGVPLVLFAVLGGSLFDFTAAGDQRYIQQGVDVTAFVQDRKDLLSNDSWRSLLLILLAAGSLWLYINDKIKSYVAFSILGLLVIFDVVGVSSRYVAHSDFKGDNTVKQVDFTPRPVDQQIKSIENDRARYRIQDLSINTNNSSSTSFMHNTIGGYDPAKLRRFQDVLEKYISANNQAVYNMLNTKYFIVNGENGPVAQTNAGALGNAWFVKSVVTVNTADEEFNALSRFDPSTSAVVLAPEFKGQIDGFSPIFDSLATIDLVSYEPDRLVYKSKSNTDQFAVFSEIWYNGNRDWVSYLDGVKYDHLRANYLLRAMKIPAGEHEIIFEFKPVVYAQGEIISMVSWWILILTMLGGLYVLLKPWIVEYRKNA